jgi:hypothetical protein
MRAASHGTTAAPEQAHVQPEMIVVDTDRKNSGDQNQQASRLE